MSDICVHIFVQNLRELMKSQHPKIAGEKDQLETLYKDVLLMSSFLKKQEEKCLFDDEKVNNLVTEIRELVLETEYMVDHFMIDKRCMNLKSLEKHIEKVKIEVNQMNAAMDQSTTLVRKKNHKPRERYDGNLEDVVGMEEIIENILAGFDGDQEMEVIPVVGLPGIGKTTLVQKVFEHCRTRSSFQVRAWVTVSQTYSPRSLLIDILKSSSLYKDGDESSSEDRLGEDLLKRLKDKKYLIVLDDIWSIEAWNGIQRSFPSNNNGSRVIYTSRSAAIGKGVFRDINTHIVSGLSEEQSWNLLQNKVFGGGDCPPDLERFGREIAGKCDGLPLAIVVIGGILAKKEKTAELWEQVARRLAPAIATDREAYMDTLALSYQHLPVHLKACFLYLGTIFPEDYEIPVRNLVWLLVAEGFSIQENNKDQQIQSSEVIVEGYLYELVERSLVTISRKTAGGATKTIRIHDLLRDFCLVQGEQEKFIGQRRMLVSWEYLRNERYLSSSLHLRSLFLKDWNSYGAESEVETFAHNFRLLKVLQVDGEAGGLLNKIGKKAHLRYLAATELFYDAVFTSSVTKLLYLETIFIHTRKDTNLPDDIWNMVKLRHLYKTRGTFHFKVSSSQQAETSSVLPDLQTLHTLCSCRSCLQQLVRTPNLKMLGLEGWNIPDLDFLDQLITLKVTLYNNYSLRLNPLFKLRLPASLRKLTLNNTLLEWHEISVLAELENLEVLKLLNHSVHIFSNADSGWDTSDLEFRKLKYLKMQNLNIQKWVDSNLQFESLEVLALVSCSHLGSIPFDLALSPSLHTIKLEHNSLPSSGQAALEMLAMEIAAEHESQCGNSDLQVIVVTKSGVRWK